MVLPRWIRRTKTPTRRTPALIAVGVLGLAVLGLPASAATADTRPPPATPATPVTVSADSLPTWQINGVVWAQVVVGSTVWVTGSFTQAGPPGVPVGGAGWVPALNIFAYNITTGLPVPGFRHSLNSQGNSIAAAPDGSRVYVGGDFTSVDGEPRGHLAAFDTATNSLSSAFAASVSARVSAIVVTKTTVYVGGAFFSAGGGKPRNQFASFAVANGALGTWAPVASGGAVATMAMAPDGSRLIVGGAFTQLNGVTTRGMGSVDSAVGKTNLPWIANQTIKDSTPSAGITSLVSDGKQIYGSGYSAGSGGSFEGTFAADPYTGKIAWLNDCHGDTYGVFPMGQVLYSVSHAKDCSAIGAFPQSDPVRHHALASTTYATGMNRGPDTNGWNYSAWPDSALLTWFPSLGIGSYTGQGQAAWSVTGNANYVVLGGEFPSVNGRRQQGLARFAVSPLAPNKVGPEPLGSPSAGSPSWGAAQVSWRATWDMDNASLTYKIIRYDAKGASTTAGSLTAGSSFWSLPTLKFLDRGATPRASYTYAVQASDPFGNTVTSARSNPVTIAASPGAPRFQTTDPCRLFDTRTGGGTCAAAVPVTRGKVGPGGTLQVKVAGVAGVPADATAVVLNLTAVGASSATYVTAWPDGQPRPLVSNLNVAGPQATPNLVVVPIGAGGSIDLYNTAGTVDLLGDLAGYFAPEARAGFSAVGPCRVFDTRTGGGACTGAGHFPRAKLGPGATLRVKVSGVAGVPANATSVVLNLTAVSATVGTYVTAWADGRPRPVVSNLNVVGPGATPNLAVVPIGTDGYIDLYNAAGSVDLLGDLAGYFAPTVSGWFAGVGPCRAMDTRVGAGTCPGAGATPIGKVGTGGVARVQVAGIAGVPFGAAAVVLNVTAVGASVPTYVTAWADGGRRPVVSNLNVAGPQATPNLVVVPVGPGGFIDLYNAAGRVDLIVDLTGYFAS